MLWSWTLVGDVCNRKCLCISPGWKHIQLLSKYGTNCIFQASGFPACLWMTVSPYWIMFSTLHLVLIICKYAPFVFLLLIRPVVLITASLLFTAGPCRGQAIKGFKAVGGLETVVVTVANPPQSLANDSWGCWGGLDHCGCENGAAWGILKALSHLISSGSDQWPQRWDFVVPSFRSAWQNSAVGVEKEQGKVCTDDWRWNSIKEAPKACPFSQSLLPEGLGECQAFVWWWWRAQEEGDVTLMLQPGSREGESCSQLLKQTPQLGRCGISLGGACELLSVSWDCGAAAGRWEGVSVRWGVAVSAQWLQLNPCVSS